MTDKQKVSIIRDSVKLIERRYEGGLVEISVYIKAIWAGVAPILVGVVSSQKVEGQGRKWHAYDAGTKPRVSNKLKSRVVDSAVSIAQCKADAQRKQHGEPQGTW
jgi:hypothetical protein